LQLIEREIAHANTTRFTPIQQATAESDASKLLRWLEPEKDEASHFEFDFAAALKAPTPNTCGWITDGGPVDSWIQDSHSKTLWMTGKPGCGKFVLSVHITGTLNDRHEADFDVAYYSFRHGDIAKRSPTAFLKSVLYQLVSMNETFLQDLWPIYEKSTKDRAKEDSFNELSAALLAMCERSSSLLFVINGLDACHDIPSILAIIQKATNTRLLILSRPSSEIQRCLGNSPFTSLEISKSMVTDAVKMYAGYRIEESDLFLHLNNDVLERLEDAIVEAADGMFLCARLLLDIIFSQPSQPGTEADVDEMIATLPKGLDNIYSIVIDNLEAEVDQIQRIFNWLIVAARPLRLSELGVLLDIGVVRSDAPDPVEQAIRAICGPLVQVFEGSVFLVHPTVKDYLLSGQAAKLSLNVPEANKQATDTCLKYLLLPQFESVGRMRLESVTIRLGSLNMREGQVWESEAVRDLDLSYPLLQYAASFWPKHAVLADASSDALLESVAKFFESPNCMTWVHLYTHEFGYSLNHLFALQSDLQKWLSTREVRPQNLPPISSISDFPRSIRSKAVEINKAKLGVDHTETWIAVYNLAVAEEQAGRLTQAEIGYRQAAASFPRLLGASNVWTLRAQCGIASVHWRRGEVEDALALCTAAVEGLRQLPDSTTDLAYALDQLGTLYAEIEKMRFSGKKTIEVKGSQFQAYNNALKYHEEALELYQKALGPLARRTLEVRNHLAVDRQIGGYRKMASDMYRELVKDATAALGERHPSTLGFRQNLAAAYVDLGMLDEAEEILSSAVDETAEIMGHNDARLFSVLHNRGVLAMKRGQLEQAEADMSKSFSGRVAALGLKHEETLSSLDKLATIVWMQGRLEEAERIHLREKSLQDYLTSARTGADHQRILTRGAIPIPDRTKDTYKSGSMFCVDRKDWDSNGQTPLHWASIKGWSDRVRILCELDNKVNAQGPEQMTPVHCAVMGGSIEVVQYLIQRGHSPSTPDSCGLTPLHHASYLGHIEICRFLVRQDPSLLKAFTKDGSTAFYLAHYNKEKENIGTLVALLESGMNPDVGFGYKIRSRHPEVMAVLELYGSSVIVIDSILESAPHDDVVSLLKAGCGKHLARATNAQLSSDAFRQIKGKMDPSLYGRDIQDMAAPNILAALLAKNADVNERNNPYFGWVSRHGYRRPGPFVLLGLLTRS
jgi:tetratricopeptide (TPR) repeat protein